MAATTYVVVRERGVVGAVNGTEGDWAYAEEATVEANNAEQACRRVAEKMSDDDLKDGVTLIAVPARNWTSGRNTFAAKTERKLIRS